MAKATPTETSLSTYGHSQAPAPAAPETEIVTSWKVSCSGDVAGGAGHPRVWMVISPDVGWVECGYCDKRFVIDPLATDDH